MHRKYLLLALVLSLSTAVSATHTGQYLHEGEASPGPTAMLTVDTIHILFIFLGGLLVFATLIYLTGRVDFWNAIRE